MRHFFVINPHSFRTLDTLKQILMDLENCFSIGRRMEYKIYISRRPRDAVAAVHRYMTSAPSDETVRVYAVGGDGILFDCLNGMVDFPNAELTNVPYGNANDVIRAFGEDAVPAFRNIKNLSVAPSRPLDIIHCGANYAMNEANIGIIGLTMIYANPILRNATKQWYSRITPHIYTTSAMRAMLNEEVRNQKYTVTIDGEDFSGAYSNIHISNGPCTGGTMTPNPYAVLDDGFLDVIFHQPRRLFESIKVVNDYVNGRFEKYEKIYCYRRCRTIQVYSALPLYVQMDGEAFLAKEMKLEIIPGGIKFFAPENMEFADYSHRAYRKGRRGGNNEEK